MKMKTTATIAVAVVAIMVLSVAVSTTYSWFSDTEKTTITLTTATVDIEAGIVKEDDTLADTMKLDTVLANWSSGGMTYSIVNKSSISPDVSVQVRTWAEVSVEGSDKKKMEFGPDTDIGQHVFIVFDGREHPLGNAVRGSIELSPWESWAVETDGVTYENKEYEVEFRTDTAFSTPEVNITVTIKSEAVQGNALERAVAFKATASTQKVDTVVMSAGGTDIPLTVEFTGLTADIEYVFTADSTSVSGFGTDAFIVDFGLVSKDSASDPLFTNAKVTYRVPEAMKSETILHIDDQGGISHIGATVSDIKNSTDKNVTFETTSFSQFVLFDGTVATANMLLKVIDLFNGLSDSGDAPEIPVIRLLPGTYDLELGTNSFNYSNTLNVNGLTIIGSVNAGGEPVTTITSDNVTRDNPPVDCALYAPVFKNAAFENIVFGERTHGIRYSSIYGSVSFDNCVFDAEQRGFHCGTADETTSVSFNGCTFVGKNSFAGSYDSSGGLHGSYEFDRCKFTLAGEGYYENSMRGVGVFTDCTFEDGVTLISETTTIKEVNKGYGSINDIRPELKDTSKNMFILTVDQLRHLASKVNAGDDSCKGKTVYLASNLDLENKEWTPIGNSTNKFQGTFDGQNHKISNLKITGYDNYVGLFGFTTDGEIKNLVVENADVSGRLGVGVVAGSPYTSKYTNIKVIGHVEVDGMAYVGGVGGRNAYANWTDITVHVDDDSYVNANSVEDGTAYRTYVGGVIGFMGEGGHGLTNVTSNIDVTGSTCDVGGIVGIAHYGNSFINCSSSGVVTITGATEAADAEEIGGIAGVWMNSSEGFVTFKYCIFTGTLAVNVDDVNLKNNVIVGNSYYSDPDAGKLIIDDSVSAADDLVEALENVHNVLFMNDIKIDPAGMSNAYGTTGINVKNGQTIDGNGHILDIKGAGGTWDSGINTTGGLIKNITVTGSFRGIFINHNSDHSEKVVLENVIIKGTTYTISCDQGTGNGLEATNCTFKGWTSYAATLGTAKFVGCLFGEGNGYAYCRPYAPTEFVDCSFEAGFRVDPRAAVTFENCTLDGVAITSENLSTLVTSNTGNAAVK